MGISPMELQASHGLTIHKEPLLSLSRTRAHGSAPGETMPLSKLTASKFGTLPRRRKLRKISKLSEEDSLLMAQLDLPIKFKHNKNFILLIYSVY